MKAKKGVNVPFLKWAGGKAQIIDRIKQQLPKGNRLVEPFCGSATVFLNTNYKYNLIADTNNDVINLYKHLQTEKKTFVEYCRQYFTEQSNQSEYYYERRSEFNETKDKRLKAALFLYINKHCFNGLSRYNLSGGFNVPFGRFKKVRFPEDYILKFIEKTGNAVFSDSDFSDTMASSKKGDIIYCDPPYVAVNDSNTSFKYQKGGFSLEQQNLIAVLAEECVERGIPVLISNHLTDFTMDIYKKAKITEIQVQRSISCNGGKRVKASELLALYEP